MPEDLLSLLQDKAASLGYARKNKQRPYELWIHRFLRFIRQSHLSEKFKDNGTQFIS